MKFCMLFQCVVLFSLDTRNEKLLIFPLSALNLTYLIALTSDISLQAKKLAIIILGANSMLYA